MRKIILVSAFGDITYNRNFRLNNVYSALGSFSKSFITSDFDHWDKKYKNLSELPSDGIYLHVPSYSRSLSIRRILSHLVFAYKLHWYLKSIDKPDSVYCIMPTSSSAFVCGRYCRKNNIRFIIDVIDLWPKSLFPISKLAEVVRILLYPWQLMTEKAYSYADVICAGSKEYLKIVSEYNRKAVKSCTYLGIDLIKNHELVLSSKIVLEKPENELWICYGGHLGTSYDFDSILDAVRTIHQCGIRYKFIFVGDGEIRAKIEKYSAEFDLNIIITGVLPYPDYLKYLSYCDIAINIFKENTIVVHSFKFNDYVASNLFILNSLTGETADMVSEYKIGLNFNFKTFLLKDALLEVCRNWAKYEMDKQNNVNLISKELDKKIIYNQMVKIF